MPESIKLPTAKGELIFEYFKLSTQEGLFVHKINNDPVPFLRIHSSCVFSEAFHTDDCDCARQLDAALAYVHQQGGIIIYLYQEGRGLGLSEKIESIALEQRLKVDTAEAFSILGHDPDPRSYSAAVQLLKDRGITRVRLDTTNPRKVKALEEAGIQVSERISLPIDSNERVDAYIKLKTRALGLHEKD